MDVLQAIFSLISCNPTFEGRGVTREELDIGIKPRKILIGKMDE